MQTANAKANAPKAEAESDRAAMMVTKKLEALEIT